MNIPNPNVSSSAHTAVLLRLCAAIFLGFMTLSVPLPVVPVHVRQALGHGDLVVGCIVAVQFVATVFTRSVAGRLSDTAGPARATRRGMLLLFASGVGYLLAALVPALPLAWLVLARLAAGIGESLLVTGTLAWGIGHLGAAQSGRVMTWVGTAIFAALAAGSPVGVALDAHGGFLAIAVATLLLPVLSYAVAGGVGAVAPVGGTRPPLRQVLARIWWPALGLALQGVGFATIGTFAVLYFNDRQWPGAAWLLSAFGIGFVLARLLGGRLPDRFGGARVAVAAMGVESLGLLTLGLAVSPWMGIGGAFLTGLGCSLVFPALGVEVVRRVPAQVRATALGGYAAFQDVAYAMAGPLAGLVATHLGYAAIFVCAAGSALLGAAVAAGLAMRARAP
ncbi:MAG: arabinose transporter [Gammaproteobacteria bacterium]